MEFLYNDIEMQRKQEITKTIKKITFEHIQIIVGLTILILLLMGRDFYCKDRDYNIWNGLDHHMSQHLFDHYSITHMLHGIIMFNILVLYRGYLHINLYVTIIVSCVWEILENTNFIIEIYRKDALHNGYYGDSIINSIGDIMCCIMGYYVSKMIGTHKSIMLFIFCECMLLIWINDNLIKNTITILCTPQLLVLLSAIIWWYVRFGIEFMIWKKITKFLFKYKIL